MQREKATRATSMSTEVQAMHTVTKEGRTHVMFLDVETVPESERPLYAGHVETTKDSGGRTHVRFDDGATPAPEVEIQNQINGRSYVNFDSPGRLQPRHLASETKSCVNDGLHTTDPLSHCPFPDDGAPEDLESAQAWHRALDSVWAEDDWGSDYEEWPDWEGEPEQGQGSDSENELEADFTGETVLEQGKTKNLIESESMGEAKRQVDFNGDTTPERGVKTKAKSPVESKSKSEAKNQTPVSMQSIFDKESNLSTSDIFAALVQAEEASLVASSSPRKGSSNDAPKYGQRHRVSLPLWPLDDVVLQDLLAFWQSGSCHYGGDHDQRLKYVAKYLAFEVTAPEAGKLNIRVQMCDTAKITRYLDFLSSKNQSPATILKSLDMIRHTLNWVVMRRLKPKGKAYLKKYTGCCQAREVLAELRSAWQAVSNRDNRRTTTIGSILRANKWPTDEEVQTIVDKSLPMYKLLRARCKQDGRVTDGEMQWVLSLVANACTIHVTFGRPSLFQRLTVSHGERAVQSQVVGTSEFKTWSKWFINSMFFAGGARSLLKDWLEIWRPVAAKEAPEPSDPLFVDRNNQGIENWSRVLSLLWERTFKRSMTATILRYWKATKVALRAETKEERKLVFEADW